MKTNNVKGPKFKKYGTQNKYEYQDLNYTIGSVNKYDCKAVYIELGMWMNSHKHLKTSMEAIRKRFIKKIGSYSQIYFDDLKTTLIDYVTPDLNSNAAIGGKSTYISIELTLLANGRFEWDEDLIDRCKALAGSAYDELLSMDDLFEIRSYK